MAKYLGDGVVAFFGYPRIHEDDSKRAIMAGLAIVEAIRDLNPSLDRQYGIQLSVRIGIHTGVVIAGEMGSLDKPVMDIVGESPNIAARLQEVAPPNTVVISAETHRLTEKSFSFESLGPILLKGNCASPCRFFRCWRRRNRAGLLTPVVGRQDELGQIAHMWKRAKLGHGQLVLIRGEAGIGKSALTNSMLDKAHRDPEAVTISLHCSPYHENSPFYPVVEYLRSTQMQVSRSDPMELQLQRLENFLLERGFEPAEAVPILGPLLSIDYGQRYSTPLLSPEGLRIRTVELILDLAVRRTDRYALVLVLDDLHWADPSTLELFSRVLSRISELRMLIIATYRPMFQPQFVRPGGTLEITLGKLNLSAVRNLATMAAGGRELPEAILSHIAEKTDGIPLFVEELTKAIIESGAVALKGDKYDLAKPIKEVAIPTTLQGSLAARLERVGGRREIAKVAAVVGREFTTKVVAAVAKVSEDEVDREISDLVSSDLVYPVEGLLGSRSYRFRHALIQDAAYDSLLKSARQQYHSDVAQALETQSKEAAEDQPEIIANHYSAAGAVELALKWWSRAGNKALGRSANHEAIAHFTRGLELLEQLAESPERVQAELTMLVQRGTAFIATRGFAAPEVGETFRRAEAICQLIGETPLLFPVIWGLWVYHLVRSDLEVSCDYAEQMLRLADISGESGMFLEGHFTLGDSLFWMGDLVESKRHLDQAKPLYEQETHGKHTLIYGQDPGVTTLCYLSCTSWHLGFADQALAYADEAYELANKTRHPFSIGWSLAFGAMLRNWRKDFAEARIWAQKAFDYCSEQGQAFWSTSSLANLGWATFYSGDKEKGLALLNEGMAAYEGIGSIVVTPMWRAVLAESLCELNRLDEAMESIHIGLDTVELCHEWLTAPYLRRVAGDILAKQGKVDEAAAEYLHGYEEAKKQKSAVRALQAAMALATLDLSETNLLRLNQVFEGFTEGFETLDMNQAASLLKKGR